MVKFSITAICVRLLLLCLSLFTAEDLLFSQTIRGVVRETEGNKEPLFGINIIEKGSNNGASTDFNGKFELKPRGKFPITLVATGVGYERQEIRVGNPSETVKIQLVSTQVKLNEVEINDTRITEKQQEAPLTIESMNAVAIKQTSSLSFYEGLGNMKGVDITTASLGFKVINTRGFNSTSPVRSLQ
ncbi:MAG: TonB-dependent receptor, partial [Chitinophagia bacterium]|nr:TonB-dependent receptor [Chitinophagia bacterium]